MKLKTITIALLATLAIAGCSKSDNTPPPEEPPEVIPPPVDPEPPVQPILPSHPIEPEEGTPEIPWLPEQPIEGEFGVNTYLCNVPVEGTPAGYLKTLNIVDNTFKDELFVSPNIETCDQVAIERVVGDTIYLYIEVKEYDGNNWHNVKYCAVDFTLQNPSQGKNLMLLTDVSPEFDCTFTYRIVD